MNRSKRDISDEREEIISQIDNLYAEIRDKELEIEALARRLGYLECEEDYMDGGNNVLRRSTSRSGEIENPESRFFGDNNSM